MPDQIRSDAGSRCAPRTLSAAPAAMHDTPRDLMAAPACDHDLRGNGGDEAARLDGLLGRSDPMRSLCRLLRKAAATDAPVLIAGETGTGKALAARAVHRHSPRARQAFVTVDCGAVPPERVQAELFGCERDARTGAPSRRAGRIEAAHGGTLFLDEISELPPDSQAGLLRLLEQGRIERPGDHEPIAVDVRIVAATHHDLDRAVADGRFRADLYHRLSALRVQQPPLRERGGDIDLIAEHALQRHAQDNARGVKGFSPCARQAMHHHAWPGNVRELVNRVRQAVLMAEDRYVTAADLHLADALDGAPVTLEQARDAATRDAIERALRRNRRRLGAAARELDVSRVTLYRLMQRLGMRENDEARDAAGKAQRPG